MDILVQHPKLPLARSLLLEMGYQKLNLQRVKDHPFHEVYYRYVQLPFCIELHWNLDDPKLVTIPQKELWSRAQLVQIHEEDTMVLSSEDNLLFLSNNLIKQVNQLLRSLCDVAELLEKYQDVLDWKYIIESANSWGIETSVYYTLKQSKELLGAPVPVSVVNALKPKPWRRWLLGFLINEEYLLSSTSVTKIKAETYAVFRSLMMNQARRMLIVLSNFRNRGRGGSIAWLRTIIWIVLVFSAALWHNTARFLSGWR
jgi:hypothetical protein